MTTIHLSSALKARLAANRIHPRETYADVVQRALDLVEEDDLELSPEYRDKVLAAREQAASGATSSTDDLVRDLGL